MTYKLTHSQEIIRVSDGAVFPASVGNGDYSAYLAWIDAGNTPLPADVPQWASVKAALLDAVRVAREQIIDRLNGIAGRAQRAGDTVTAAACDKAVLSLLGITTLPAVVAAGNAAELKTAIKSAYAAIVAACPVNIVSAFRGVDA